MDLCKQRPALAALSHDEWLKLRKVELATAIFEHIQAGIDPQLEWLNELYGLIKSGKGKR